LSRVHSSSLKSPLLVITVSSLHRRMNAAYGPHAMEQPSAPLECP
jgi:hypothetical protein